MPPQTSTFGFPYAVSHRSIKYPRLEFKTGTLLVILPKGENETRILKKHRHWIENKYKIIEEATERAKDCEIITRESDDFRTFIKELIVKFSRELGCNPGHLCVKKMVSKWASCSKKGNITVNTLLKMLPDNLVEYVVYHELAHLKYRKHDSFFWKCIGKKFENPDVLEKELCYYWFRLQT
jgi:predicted metal-dependent hydrolase